MYLLGAGTDDCCIHWAWVFMFMYWYLWLRWEVKAVCGGWGMGGGKLGAYMVNTQTGRVTFPPNSSMQHR